ISPLGTQSTRAPADPHEENTGRRRRQKSPWQMSTARQPPDFPMFQHSHDTNVRQIADRPLRRTANALMKVLRLLVVFLLVLLARTGVVQAQTATLIYPA